MFTKLMPEEFFGSLADFMRIMGTSRDCTWWARTLITEETKELIQADENEEGMEQIFKEAADVFYVVAGFYNCMPANPAIFTNVENEEMQGILHEAWQALAGISTKYRIPMQFFGQAFAVVHTSNLSKLDDDGNPIRREDGKILKGPNYTAPDMSGIVSAWKEFLKTQPEPEETETPNDATTGD